MIYDTLKLATRLEGPFSRDQATALTEALTASTSDTIATKSDIIALRAELTDLKAELIKGIAGALVINLFGTAGLVIALTKVLAHP